MRRFVCTAIAAALLHAHPAAAQWNEEALERAFAAGMQALEAGNAADAERILREVVRRVPSARAKLELARALHAQGRLEEAKALFRQVALERETPWRVRDNIERFVAAIEQRTGYVKWGATLVSDSNPRNLAPQKEFAVGGLLVTPTEAPERMIGARYAIQAWKPVSDEGGVYASAAYVDFPGRRVDRVTGDAGVVRDLAADGRARGRAGAELGLFGDRLLYAHPYLAADALLREDSVNRLSGEVRIGPVHFPDFRYLDAISASGALVLTRNVLPTASASVRLALEHSRAAERPYSYGGAEAGCGFSVLLPDSGFLLAASASAGGRRYAAEDPLFGARRNDRRTRAELRLGNKTWRWRDKAISLVASLERNDSSIAFYGYRKAGLSLVLE